MVVCLQHYEGCARAAIRAAGRVRKPAAIESAHHAQRFLAAVTALTPLAADIEEPEELVEATQSQSGIKNRTDDERRAAVVAALPAHWMGAPAISRVARVNDGFARKILDALVSQGAVERRQYMSGYQYRRASDASIH